MSKSIPTLTPINMKKEGPMGGISAPYTGPRITRYLFIDGGCLRATLLRISQRYNNGNPFEIDYKMLTSQYTKVFYYDALPGMQKDEDEASYEVRTLAQRKLFDHLSVLDRFHVYEGEVRRGSGRRGNEQKKVDVMIAVDMLTHSFRRNMHEATLLTGDLDFKPLIDSLVLEGMFITLWYPPGETSRSLIAAADNSSPLQINTVYGSIVGNPKPFELPRSHSEPTKGEFAQVLANLRSDEGDVALLRDGGTYIVCFRDKNNRGNSMYVESESYSILREYVREVWGISIPEQI